MMYAPVTGDIVVRIPPARSESGERESSTRRYDAFIYTYLPLDVGSSITRRVPDSWRDLPLRGAGQLSLPWGRYQDHVANFQEGRKAVEEMHSRLRQTLSPELSRLVDYATDSSQPCRLWWASEAPELDDMPWELLVYGFGQRPGPATCTFVRGVPPLSPPPILPLRGPLRLAWCDTQLTPAWLREVLSAPLEGIKTIALPLGSFQAVRQAASEGYELLHLSSDGIVTLACEGVLYDHGESTRPELTAHDLSALVRGSRVSVVGLSVQDYHAPDVMEVRGREVVSAYRAFAHFSSSRVALPSLVAPLGPMEDGVANRFWRAFYSKVGTTHRLDVALADARQAAAESTFALFLRHPQGKLFRSSETRSGPDRPEQMANVLRSSQNATQSLEALRGKYGGLPSYLEGFVKEEGDRQKQLTDALEAWALPEEDER